MAERIPVAQAVVDRLRPICLSFPETHEELAWIGLRWRIRTRTFAHVLVVDELGPEAFTAAVALPGVRPPFTVLTFRTPDREADVLEQVGDPFFRPHWSGNIVGMVVRADRASPGRPTDWSEVAELLTDSYCVQAPQKLAARATLPRV